QETDSAFARFAEYLDYIVASPGIKLVTASELPKLYADPIRRTGASERDLETVIGALLEPAKKGADFLSGGGTAYSLADQFESLTAALGELIDGRALVFPHRIPTLLRPDHEPSATEMTSIAC